MARGVKKPVEEKIREKREIIAALKIRIQKENEELEVLLKEEREKKAIEMAQQTGDQNNGDGEEPTGKKPEDNKTETK